MLFSICRSAQAAAASGALDAATGVTAANGSLQQRCGSVRQEAVVEMLTRLLIDWPRVMQAEPDVAAVARVRRSREDEILDTCRDVACTSVFGVDCEPMAQRDESRRPAALARSRRNDAGAAAGPAADRVA